MKNFLLPAILLLLLFNLEINAQGGALPFGRTTYFSGSGNCAICHTGDGNVLSQNGVDISPPTYWRSTMMGNASKDPIWRAMVAEEVHNYPQLQEFIESTCTRCHAPLGYTEAIYAGQSNYSMNELRQDPIANDGVSCTACHQIKPDNFGAVSSYSGHYIINQDSLIYGPYQNPETMAMFGSYGFLPVYAAHMNKSELCATCHTLFTPFVDNQGNIAGEFPEQTPYLEWKNSVYPSQNLQCQDCHMPKILDPIDIATIPPTHQVLRSPYWKHTFVGGNVYMLKILQANIDSLGVTATPDLFDSTIARAEYNLTEKAMDLIVTSVYENDSSTVKVKIQNKAGHKIPSGIPFRRMWVHLKVEDASANIAFESGNWNNTGEIIALDNDYEPHYQTIRSEDQVQIYEGVFVDVDQDVTYRLLRASQFVKDNRIPPVGFNSSHPSYDSTAVYGNALSDPDFNKENSVEGTGSDIITYRIPASSNTSYRITAEVCFQSIKPRVVEYLQTISEPDVIKFVNMYNALPNVPFIMKTETVDVLTNIKNEFSTINSFNLEQNYPNPFNPSTLINYQIAKSSNVTLKVFSVKGELIETLVNEYKSAGLYKIDFNSKHSILSSGIYFYKLEAVPVDGSTPFREVKKMVLLK